MAEAATAKGTSDALGTGRRKSAVARVRVRSGSGNITINKRPLDEYFAREQDRNAVLEPLAKTGKRDEVDVLIETELQPMALPEPEATDETDTDETDTDAARADEAQADDGDEDADEDADDQADS